MSQLLQVGKLSAVVEAQDRLGWTPLHAAARAGQWEALNALLTAHEGT
jgi:ankyrin repeat protein